MKRLFLNIYFLFSIACLYAQHSINIYVYDLKDSMPLYGTAVHIFPQDTIIVTDSLGHCVWDPITPENILLFKYVGYYDEEVYFDTHDFDVNIFSIFLRHKPFITDKTPYKLIKIKEGL